jgi:hypothetical protein
MKRLLWLDDIRNPFQSDWIIRFAPDYEIGIDDISWAKNFEEFTEYFALRGMPDLICFDHDLGEDSPSGHECAKWLVNYCMDQDLNIPDWRVQSANPVGKENINCLLFNYKKSRIL